MARFCRIPGFLSTRKGSMKQPPTHATAGVQAFLRIYVWVSMSKPTCFFLRAETASGSCPRSKALFTCAGFPSSFRLRICVSAKGPLPSLLQWRPILFLFVWRVREPKWFLPKKIYSPGSTIQVTCNSKLGTPLQNTFRGSRRGYLATMAGWLPLDFGFSALQLPGLGHPSGHLAQAKRSAAASGRLALLGASEDRFLREPFRVRFLLLNRECPRNYTCAQFEWVSEGAWRIRAQGCPIGPSASCWEVGHKFRLAWAIQIRK